MYGIFVLFYQKPRRKESHVKQLFDFKRIFCKKKILLEIKAELEKYKSKPTFENYGCDYIVYAGYYECEVCGKLIKCSIDLAPYQTCHVYCGSCQVKVKELSEDINKLSRKMF